LVVNRTYIKFRGALCHAQIMGSVLDTVK